MKCEKSWQAFKTNKRWEAGENQDQKRLIFVRFIAEEGKQ